MIRIGRSIFRRTRHAFESLVGTNLPIRRDIKIPNAFHGSDYGGWCVPEQLLQHGSIVYSFGIGKDISFDISIIENYGVTVHGFDPTPRSIDWISSQKLTSKFIMHCYGLSDKSGSIEFEKPSNDSHVSYRASDTILSRKRASISLPVKNILDIMRELEHEEIDLIKMDIEGSEYSVIESLIRGSVRPRCILVEFHHRQDKKLLESTKNAITQLREVSYQIFWVSDTGSEVGFLLSR